ncbi:MAG: protein kinase, partial [Ktedonobacteraceae bacterium]|nr:protein kinase [Ktedonobacteraceae bacterium]
MREQHGPRKEQYSSISESQNRRSFGNYDLVRRIDVGGMGEVYLARQRSAFGREVAVKIIRSDLMHDITARKRFLREAEVSAHLKHEHILPLFEFGEEQGRLFLVTPYIEGGTLGHRLQSGPLSLSETHQLFSALVQAVAYIHKRGVVHRDLKPSNILLDKDDETGQIYVRLIDFGIASLPGLVGEAQLTTAGNEMGTIAYMAPERLDGVAAPGNDTYSLGIILYQMLTGQLPDNNMVALAQPLDVVIKRCIASNPADRYANADELLRAFEYACRTVRATPSRPQLPATPVAARPATPVSTPAFHHLDLDNLPDPDDFDEDEPTPRRVTAPPPALSRLPLPQKNTVQEERIPQRSELILAPLSPSGNTFSRADYNAPTTSIDPVSLSGQQQMQRVTHTATLGMKPELSPPPKRKRSALVLIPIAIVVILLAIAGTIFMTLPALVTAKITISPQVHPISNTFTLNTNSNLQSIDPASNSVPLETLSITDTITKTGPTTGKSLPCVVFGIDCQKIVSDNDVNQLGLQARQDTRITQDLNSQLQARNATQVGNPNITIVNGNVNPPIGTKSDTVTISLTEQASVHYILNKDAQNLAHILLLQQVQQQFGPNYRLLDQMTQMGQPHVQAGDNSPRITIAIASLVEYHMPASQTGTIAGLIKGKKLQQA